MAWFHKTLTDMKSLITVELQKPVEERDWTKVKAILEEHQHLSSAFDGEISEARMSMKSYDEHLRNVSILVGRRRLVGGEADDVLIECENTIRSAKRFEDAIKKLIADDKFLE